MNYLYKYIVYFFLIGIISCRNKNTIICSQDFNKCISIKDVDNVRYIYYDNSDSNYVKLDMTKVDYETDAIFICWNNEYNKMEIINPNTKIQEAKIDTRLYQFFNTHELDSSGMPKILKFHQKGNIELGMKIKSIFPVNANVKVSSK